MCYHVAQTRTRDQLARDFEAEVNGEVNEYYHVSGFEHPHLPVITAQNPQKIEFYEWGLIPKWCKDEVQAIDLQNLTLNAKAETLEEKPSFKHLLSQQRCLVLVNGFFEWQEVKRKKYPYFIHWSVTEKLAMGGLYDIWLDKSTGELKKTFSIITTTANSLLATIHNTKKRMPLIFNQVQQKTWLNLTQNQAEQIALMQSYQGHLEAFTVSKLVSQKNQTTNLPEVQKPFIYPELLPQNQLF
jgi:putative SOS response-associated peptidase YedK